MRFLLGREIKILLLLQWQNLDLASYHNNEAFRQRARCSRRGLWVMKSLVEGGLTRAYATTEYFVKAPGFGSK